MRIYKRSIAVAGSTVPLEVIRSRRAKRMSIEYGLERGVIGVLPLGVSEEHLRRFLKSKEDWLRQRVLETADLDAAFPRRPLETGARVLYLGSPLELRIVCREAAVERVTRQDGVLEVRAPEGGKRKPEDVLEAWYRARARAHLQERLDHFAERFGTSYRRLTVRAQRRRWGSCSSGRRISLNWRLILAPPAVVDYVIVHELTHVEEMSHSDRYYGLVAARCPNHRAFDAWLTTYGPVLTLERGPDLRHQLARTRPPTWGGKKP